MKIAIVGSRRRLDKWTVVAFVKTLKTFDVVISGGCRGVDTWAVTAAKERGLKTIEKLPKLCRGLDFGERVQAYYARNLEIVLAADLVVAFVAPDRTGGTENTIKHAEQYGIPIKVVYPKRKVTALIRKKENIDE